MKAHLLYLRYVLVHKYHVFRMGLKLRVPLLQLLMHDMSKFRPSEWFPYVAYFNHGRRDPEALENFARAWNHHQKRNKHHWQYWLLTMDSGETQALPIPARYVFEMVADWYGAGKMFSTSVPFYEWYQQNRGRIVLHEYTRLFLEEVLTWPQVRGLSG
jgi:hypothetical protein